MHSYGPEELFHVEVDSNTSQAHEAVNKAEGIIDGKALRIIPKDQQRRMGMVNVSALGSQEMVYLTHDCRQRTVGSYRSKLLNGRRLVMMWRRKSQI